MGSSLNIPVPIIIGTKPLNCVVEQYETQHRVPIQELVKATDRATFISENSLRKLLKGATEDNFAFIMMLQVQN